MKLIDNQYSIQGIPVTGLCGKYDTPLYVYDANKILHQYHTLKNAFKISALKINYACKANTNLNILRLLAREGAGLDTVSIQEVQLGLKAGFKADDILFTPNSVSLGEINEACRLGVKINIDNISILEQFGHQHNGEIPVCIRINPHILAGGNTKISTGHIDSKFGISIHQFRHIERVIKANHMHIEGLHMHTGSDILDVDVFIRAAEILFEMAFSFPELKYIDLGSGFKVPYKPGDISTNVVDLGKKLDKRFDRFCREYGRKLTLIFEPGKYLVSEAGYFFAKVNVVKQTTATVFAGLDTGFNHLIRPMFYDAYHHIVNVSKPASHPRIYTVVGYICETDTFGWDRKIQEISEGDILCFYNAGAYCYSMASNYNSRPKPAEVIIYNGKDYLASRREELDDLLKNYVEIEL
ncbi:MAG: diaminopimelate decarboxylase [Sphingobacteriales bacterium]|nr:diaminopimelate decarboxylase [Sphingobacteriales bacterium]